MEYNANNNSYSYATNNPYEFKQQRHPMTQDRQAAGGTILPYGQALDETGYRPYFQGEHQPQHEYLVNYSGIQTPDSVEASSTFYPGFLEHQQHDGSHYDHWQSQQQPHSLGITNATSPSLTGTVDPGRFSAIDPIVPSHFGAPVSAVAYDNAYQAIYVASHCQPLSTNHAARSSTSLTAASMLVTQSTKDGMPYSVCAGHPQASMTTLQKIYQLLYNGPSFGGQNSLSSPTHPASRFPSHTYRPPYGRTSTPSTTIELNGGHMGISHILPLKESSRHQQLVATISVAAVRVHTIGGLCLTDRPIEGMLCGDNLQQGDSSVHSHILVGGLPVNSGIHNNDSRSVSCAWHSINQPPVQHYQGHIHTLDPWQDLRIVVSRTLNASGSGGVINQTVASDSFAVTSVATTFQSSILAGCSDGFVRMLDSRSLREVAKVKSHAGGVVQIATDDINGGCGSILASTGYASRGASTTSFNQYHAFPDTTVLIYDVRYLGRGGVPHPFCGIQGGPRFLTFIPSHQEDEYGGSRTRLLVASGQAGGGIQIIQPFHTVDNDLTSHSNFIVPPLDRGESVTAMHFDHDECLLALGTSAGHVLQYKMAKYPNVKAINAEKQAGTTFSQSGRLTANHQPERTPFASTDGDDGADDEADENKKETLEIPSYIPDIPVLSLEANILQNQDGSARPGANENIKSIFGSFTMCVDPKLSCLGAINADSSSSMGKLAEQRIIASGRRTLASNLLNEASKASKNDFLVTVPVSNLKIDLMGNHCSYTDESCQTYKHKLAGIACSSSRAQQQQEQLPNPNKLLFAQKLNSFCYAPSLCRRMKSKSFKQSQRTCHRSSSSDDDSMPEDNHIPPRYRSTLRPTFKAAGTFDHSQYNNTELWPGWDYPNTMPNAFAPAVLMMLFFIPEVRAASLNAQSNGQRTCLPSTSIKLEKSLLSAELGYLFYQVVSRSRHAMSYPLHESTDSPTKARIGAWFPSNFLSTLACLPEAEALQILDGSPAAVETPRRPEAFLRFLLYQLDKELTTKDDIKLMDSLSGIDFVSINEFIAGMGPPTQTCTRALTVDLAYDQVLARREQQEITCFGELLRFSLHRETRLRAWNKQSRSYETTVQRKIATSLPSLLSLSCACAGRKEEEGMFVWRSGECFLPDLIEVSLESDGNVVVRQKSEDEQGNPTWTSFHGDTTIPPEISSIVSKNQVMAKRKQVYRLDAVVSYVRDEHCNSQILSSRKNNNIGHHVLHMRVPSSYRNRSLMWQCQEVERLLDAASEREIGDLSPSSMTLTAGNSLEIYQHRREQLMQRLSAPDEHNSHWVLFNGFVVSETVGEDARAFNALFKEPCLVIYRAVESDSSEPMSVKAQIIGDDPVVRVPPEVFLTKSLSTGKPQEAIKTFVDLPKIGDLIAFDAEFVSVQEEETTLNEMGQKFVVQETRHAVARISVVDCRRGRVLLDDHVLPREPIADCLTRFSGIVAADLDPKLSPHHLVSTQSAYLKLRYLVETGCIFVGHSVSQDFWQMNLVVPPDQIIDTVHIFHQDRMRYISLRFLANYVLHRDMQQDTHDSVEDAKAAYDLYVKAAELRREAKLDKFLQELYEFGQKVDWKVGIEDP